VSISPPPPPHTHTHTHTHPSIHSRVMVISRHCCHCCGCSLPHTVLSCDACVGLSWASIFAARATDDVNDAITTTTTISSDNCDDTPFLQSLTSTPRPPLTQRAPVQGFSAPKRSSRDSSASPSPKAAMQRRLRRTRRQAPLPSKGCIDRYFSSPPFLH